MTRYVMVVDQSRCIGCEACVQACMECGTHRGQSLTPSMPSFLYEAPGRRCAHAITPEVHLLSSSPTLATPEERARARGEDLAPASWLCRCD